MGAIVKQDPNKALDAECRREVLHVAELQGDDYHLDRPLFFACRGDKERLCGQVRAGEGRIFSCLLEHMEDPQMSDACRDKMKVRKEVTIYYYYLCVKVIVCKEKFAAAD